MNRKEKIFSVTMTENEFRLFSEFLSQKEFYFDAATSALQYAVKSRKAKDYLEGQDKMDEVYNRMSIKHALAERDNALAREQEITQITNNPDSGLFGGRIKFHSKDQRDRLSNLFDSQGKLVDRTVNLHKGEQILRNSGYDDKYSSRLMERVMDRKLDSDDLANIVDERVSKSSKYTTDPEVGAFGNIKRKLDDASIVYEAGTDGRSLGKDAALAAAGVAALGAGIHAIRKHRKKKKEAQALLESRINNNQEKED